MITEKAKTNPEVLIADPIWMEKLKTAEGFDDYLFEKNVDFGEDDFYKYPELNVLMMTTPDDYLMKSIPDLYFSGQLNEKRLRLDPHIDAMVEESQIYDEECEKLLTINNEQWVDRLKKDTKLYIDTVMDPKWQEWSTSYAKTMDNKRVDIGLVISREPIFLEYIYILIYLDQLIKIWNLVNIEEILF